MEHKDIEYEDIQALLKKYEKHLNEYVEAKEQRDRDDINLFSSISDAYKRENYNSDILRFILDPKTLGDIFFLQDFLHFIGLSNTIIESYFKNPDDIEVLREKHRIDILIRNNKSKKAVIIESKINGANDQPMQLVRYYKKVTKEDRYTILKIVYLTIYPTRPELYYEKGFDISKREFEGTEEKKGLKEIIEKLLFNTFISAGNSNHKFQKFLENKNSDIIQQYKKLVDKLGGNVLMEQKEIIKEIFKSSDDRKRTIDFMEIWQNRGNTLFEIFHEDFPKLLKDANKWEEDKDRIFCSKDKFKDNIQLFYYAYSDSENLRIQIGFHAKKTVLKNNKATLKKILKKIFTDLQDDDIQDENSEWYYTDYAFNEDKSIDVFFADTKDKLKQLQEAAKQLK